MEELKLTQNRIISVKFAKKLIICIIFIFVFDFFFFPLPTLAAAPNNNNTNTEVSPPINIPANAPVIANNNITTNSVESTPQIINTLPNSATLKIKHSGYYTLTAYNSDVGQTDGSPCITANGFNLCQHGIEDSVAANFLPFGTKIMIPELFGDRVFVVRDRMNEKYDNRIDIWMLHKNEAKQFGIKIAKVEILGDH